MSTNKRSAGRPFHRPQDATAPMATVNNAAAARTGVGAQADDQSANPATSATTKYANRVGVKP